MVNDLGIVYLIENAQQFWSELDDILNIPTDNTTTLSRLDSALLSYLSFAAAYHEQYLQSPLQLQHACDLLLDSELFTFHSERMCDILLNQAQTTTDPHTQLILYHILLFHGRRQPAFLRSPKRWHPLLPLLMDHLLVEMDPNTEDTYQGGTSGTAVPIPIEAKLRSLGTKILYEVCRVQRLSLSDLRLFDDSFIGYLFDLVEQTREMEDETFNYSVIKLIVALNEQFMVACLSPSTGPGDSSPRHPNIRTHSPAPRPRSPPPTRPLTPSQASGTARSADTPNQNRVLAVLMRRLWSSKTFGENIIFMLNRATRSPEDLCMQLLVLKMLYLLFTTKGTTEYFYTNDLCVLVDVVLRDVVDLDEDCESLRHTYLRVLHPLLSKTQLRTVPYKRAQIVLALEGLIRDEHGIRDVHPTTRRLVERVLSGEWCALLRRKPSTKDREALAESAAERATSPGTVTDAGVRTIPPMEGTRASGSAAVLERQSSVKSRALKTSRSFEPLSSLSAAAVAPGSSTPRAPARPKLDEILRPSNGSSVSVEAAVVAPKRAQIRSGYVREPQSPMSDTSPPTHQRGSSGGQRHLHHPPSGAARRSAPAPPPKRRKPPAVPSVARATVTRGASGA